MQWAVYKGSQYLGHGLFSFTMIHCDKYLNSLLNTNLFRILPDSPNCIDTLADEVDKIAKEFIFMETVHVHQIIPNFKILLVLFEKIGSVFFQP